LEHQQQPQPQPEQQQLEPAQPLSARAYLPHLQCRVNRLNKMPLVNKRRRRTKQLPQQFRSNAKAR
jgi:hypothetical protein